MPDLKFLELSQVTTPDPTDAIALADSATTNVYVQIGNLYRRINTTVDLDFFANHTVPANAQVIGNVNFRDDNSAGGQDVIYGQYRTLIETPTSGSEDAESFLSVIKAGALTDYISLNEANDGEVNIKVNADLGGTLNTHTIPGGTGTFALTSDLTGFFDTAGTGLTNAGSTVNVIGTVNRITANANDIDIAATYVGQTSIVTLGTIGTGTWNADVIVTGKIATILTGKTLTTATIDGDLNTISDINETQQNVSVGVATTVLTSNGVGLAPTYQAPPGGEFTAAWTANHNNGGSTFALEDLLFADPTDDTKKIQTTLDGMTTGITAILDFNFTTAKTITFPDATDTLVGKATTDILTNKTINTASNTITVVSADVSDLATSTVTFSNKTIDGDVNTIVDINETQMNVSVGAATTVLTSNGVGLAPTYAAPAGGEFTAAWTADHNQGGSTFGLRDALFVDPTVTTKKLQLDLSGMTAAITATLAGVFTTAKTLTLPDATDTLVGKATTDILTNKTINTASNTITVVSADVSDLATSTVTFSNKTIDGDVNTIVDINETQQNVSVGASTTVLTSNGVGLAPTYQAPAGGEFTAGWTANHNNGGSTFALEDALFADPTDDTKKLQIDLAGGTTGITAILDFNFTTAKTITFPDATDTLVGRDTTDTLTNKTINTASNTITVVSADVSDLATSTVTFTNKTIDGDVNTIIDINETQQNVSVGASTTVLTSNGVGLAPTYQAPAGGEFTAAWSANHNNSGSGFALEDARFADPTDDTKVVRLTLDGMTTGITAILDFNFTTAKTVTFPDATFTVVGKDTTDVFTNKSIDANGTGNVITNIGDAETETFTTTKISTLNKALLNSAIVYNDQANTFGAFAQRFPTTQLQLDNPAQTFQYIVATSAIITADKTVTLPLLTGNDTFVFEAFTQALTNKTINTASNTITVVSADVSDLATSTVTFSNKTIDGDVNTIVDINETQQNVSVGASTTVLTSNGVGVAPTYQAPAGGEFTAAWTANHNNGGSTFALEDLLFADPTDDTKKIQTALDGMTTGITAILDFNFTTAKTITFPDATDTLVGRDTTDTLTNKTINTASNTITVVSADVSDLATSTVTFTNKTIDGDVNTIIDINETQQNVSVGAATTVLTSNGVGVAPTYQTAAGGEFTGSWTANHNNTGSAFSLEDAKFADPTDDTKTVQMDLSGNTTGIELTIATLQSTAQIVQIPNTTGTDQFVLEDFIQTLTNKTINTASNTITVVSADVSDLATSTVTFSNKTIDGDDNTIVDINETQQNVSVGAATTVLTSNGVGLAPTYQTAAGGEFTGAWTANHNNGGSVFALEDALFADPTDDTKQLQIDLAGGTTGITAILDFNFTTAKTITFPDVTGNVAVDSFANVFTQPNAFQDYLEISEIAVPTVPGANLVRLYAFDNGAVTQMGFKNSSGANSPFQRSVTLTVAASDASDVTKAQADYVCDGTADEVQLLAAWGDLPNAGGRVVLSEGTFTFTNVLNLNISAQTNSVIEGQGNGTIIKVVTGFTDGQVINVAQSDGHTFRNFQIDCTGQTGGVSIGILIGATAQDCTLDGLYIHDTRGNGIGVSSGTPPTVSNTLITNCRIIDAGDSAIQINAVQQVRINGCHLETWSQVATLGKGVDIRNSDYVTVTGCYAENANADTVGNMAMIAYLGSSHIVFDGNVVRNSNSDAISLLQCDNSTISNNVIDGGKDVGSFMNDCKSCSIIGNTYKGVDRAAVGCVANTSQDSYDCVIANNTIAGMATVTQPAISIATGGTLNFKVRRCTISNNTISGVFASGTATFSTVVATNTITINGNLYTGVAGAKSGNTQFSVDTSDAAAMTDLVDSVNNDGRTGTSGDVRAEIHSDTNVGIFKTDVGGTAGNAITLVENTGDTTISVSGATFLGGLIAGQEGINLQTDVDEIVMSGNTFTDVTNDDITFTSITGGNVDFQIFDNIGDASVDNDITRKLTISTNSEGLVIGDGTPVAGTDMVQIVRTLTGTTNSHGYDENTTWSPTAVALGANSYDSALTYTGSVAASHVHSFQAAPHNNGTGILDRIVGFDSSPVVDLAGGTTTNLFHFRANDTTGDAGHTLTTQYGLFIGALSKATTNWGVYVAGVQSRFDGDVIIANGSRITLNSTTAIAPIFWGLGATSDPSGATESSMWYESTANRLKYTDNAGNKTIAALELKNIFTVKQVVGDGTEVGTNSMLEVTRDKGDGAMEGFFDGSTWTPTTAALAGNSYDTALLSAGTANINDLTGYKCGIAHGSSGTLLRLISYESGIVNNGGAVTDAMGLRVLNPTGSGTVTNNYGINVLSQSKGTNNWAISTGTGLVHFGDDVDVDGSVSMLEKAAAVADVSTYGQWWVRSDTVQSAMFTDEAGTDIKVNPQATLQFVIDGGGSVLTTGVKGDLEIPNNFEIERVTMLADQSGSVVVDIWQQTYAAYPPTNTETITSSTPPTITTALKSQDVTLTTWTTALVAGSTLRFNVDSVTTIQRVTVSIWGHWT